MGEGKASNEIKEDPKMGPFGGLPTHTKLIFIESRNTFGTMLLNYINFYFSRLHIFGTPNGNSPFFQSLDILSMYPLI